MRTTTREQTCLRTNRREQTAYSHLEILRLQLMLVQLITHVRQCVVRTFDCIFT